MLDARARQVLLFALIITLATLPSLGASKPQPQTVCKVPVPQHVTVEGAAFVSPNLLAVFTYDRTFKTEVFYVNLSTCSVSPGPTLEGKYVASGTVDNIVLVATTSPGGGIRSRVVRLYAILPNTTVIKLNETVAVFPLRESSSFFRHARNASLALVVVDNVAFLVDTKRRKVLWHIKSNYAFLEGALRNDSTYLLSLETGCTACIGLRLMKWFKVVSREGEQLWSLETENVLAIVPSMDGESVFLVTRDLKILRRRIGKDTEQPVLNINLVIWGVDFATGGATKGARLTKPYARFLYIPLRREDSYGVFVYDLETGHYRWVALNYTPKGRIRELEIHAWDSGAFFIKASSLSTTTIAFVNVTSGQQVLLAKSSGEQKSPSFLCYSPESNVAVLRVHEGDETYLEIISLKSRVEMYKLTVVVTDEEGRPLSASVRVGTTVTGTRENGTVTLLLPPGKYAVEAWAPGYRHVAKEVSLERDTRLVLTLRSSISPLTVRVSLSDGRPLSGYVRIVAVNGTVLGEQALYNGSAVFRLPDDQYIVEVEANSTILLRRQIALSGATEVKLVVPLVEYCFEIVSESGKPLTSATVALADKYGIVRYYAKGGPRIVIKAVDAVYIAKVFAEGYAEAEILVKGGKGCITISLRPLVNRETASGSESQASPPLIYYTEALGGIVALIALMALLVKERRKWVRKIEGSVPGFGRKRAR